MGGASKGAQFEREFCRTLSLWWTKGARDDIFWRTSQSGGRATKRSQKGLTTSGSYGDVTAIDPLGLPVLKEWTIELKRGNSHGSPIDLLDCPSDASMQKWEAVLFQVQKEASLAGSKGWLLVHKRDRRDIVVYCDWPSVHRWHLDQAVPFFSFNASLRKEGQIFALRYAGLKLSSFLQIVSPEEIIKWHEINKRYSA